MRCLSCGRNVPDTSQYCLACGAQVERADVRTFTAAISNAAPASVTLDGAQFIPGSILADRYRIVALLGRGGMGEVYRADDLKLGQPVALKFLPVARDGRADRLDKFRQEVRLARQVSHPHVCRVYDIAETAGQHFLSMEFIDGEDLASLLRRIGRLPADKAVQVAHQLCAGLAAAHERGVLHRDLKPANVLIDGQGRAHLADFGLAELTSSRRDTAEIAGTPGYMAPEQLAGRELTVRTDIYALGLVMYEMFTGQRALPANQDRRERAVRGAAVAPPSTHIGDLDASIERIILRCLEHDPVRRPASAKAVAAALPGGNALAAALAAGETPSPDMVAAAGEPGVISPAVAVLCLAGVLGGFAMLAAVSQEVSLIGLTAVEHAPQFFVERAHTVLRNLGYPEASANEAVGFAADVDYLQYVDEHDRSPTRWRVLSAAQPPSIIFWYRQSSRPLVPIGGTDIVGRVNPPETRSGMSSLTLDRRGRLLGLLTVPVQSEPRSDGESAATTITSPDWNRLFVEAGLPMDQFAPTTPELRPPIFADTRAAWKGVYPERQDVAIRIEAAAVMGRPVFLEIVAPWTRPNLEREAFSTSGERVGIRMRTIVAPLVSVIAILLAFYNWRRGRGDRRGAMRLALFLLAVGTISNALQTGDLQVLNRSPALIPTVAGLAWILYLALEPHLRRLWPETMIGWSRLVAGGIHDPLVGRDVLAGVVIAIGDALMLALHAMMRRWLGHPPQFPVGASSNPFDGMAASSDLLLGGRFALSRIVGSIMSIPVWSGTMLTFLLLLIFVLLLRRRSLAIAALVVTLTGVYVATHGGWQLANAPADHFAPSLADVVVFVIVQTVVVLLAVRFGLLTMLVASFASLLLTLLPIVTDSAKPYAQSSWLMVATVLALAFYGCYTALGGRSILRVMFPKGEHAAQI